MQKKTENSKSATERLWLRWEIHVDMWSQELLGSDKNMQAEPGLELNPPLVAGQLREAVKKEHRHTSHTS